MNWEIVISTAIIVSLILSIWARISRQTIPELMRGIREFIIETKEGAQDQGAEVVYYE